MNPPGILNYYLSWFKEYTASFTQNTPQEQANIQLKIEHSQRVFTHARRICAQLSLEERLTLIVCLAAILHDIGRFPQFDRFKTFNDKLSINHGLLGYKTLKKTNCLQGLPAYEQKLIQLTVLMHNRAQITPGLPQDLDTSLRVIRDADKLDIIPVILDHLQNKKSGNQVVTLELEDDPKRYTPEVLAQALSGKLVRYETMYWVNDFVLLLCSWAYAFNYACSRIYLLEQGYLKSLLSLLPRNRETARLDQKLHEHLKNQT